MRPTYPNGRVESVRPTRVRARGAGGDHEHRTEYGRDGRAPREGGVDVDEDHGRDDDPDPRDRHRVRDPGWESRDPTGRESQTSPRGELPGPRVRPVEGERLVPRSEQDRRREGRDSDDREHRGDQPDEALPFAPDGMSASGPGHHGEEDQRPEHIELLLDAQRPVVDDRARDVVLREVVGLPDCEVPVRSVQRRRRDVRAHLAAVERCHDQPGCDRGRAEHQCREREQAAHPPRPEARERDPSVPCELAQEKTGDEEAGDDVEDVDADEASGDGGEARVVEDHEDDRDRAQPLDVGSERLLADPFRRSPILRVRMPVRRGARLRFVALVSGRLYPRAHGLPPVKRSSVAVPPRIANTRTVRPSPAFGMSDPGTRNWKPVRRTP